VTPLASHEGVQAKAATAKPLSTSPPLTTDVVDKMYCQLAEIHAIAAIELVVCAHWHWSNSTPSSIQAGTGRPRYNVLPSMIRLAPSPPNDFSSQAPLRRQGRCGESYAHR
jgi:hypothetical protein